MTIRCASKPINKEDRIPAGHYVLETRLVRALRIIGTESRLDEVEHKILHTSDRRGREKALGGIAQQSVIALWRAMFGCKITGYPAWRTCGMYCDKLGITRGRLFPNGVRVYYSIFINGKPVRTQFTEKRLREVAVDLKMYASPSELLSWMHDQYVGNQRSKLIDALSYVGREGNPVNIAIVKRLSKTFDLAPQQLRIAYPFNNTTAAADELMRQLWIDNGRG